MPRSKPLNLEMATEADLIETSTVSFSGPDIAAPRAHTDEVIAAAFLDGDQLVSGERVLAPGFSVVRGIRNVYINFDGIVAVLPIRIS